MGLTMPLFGALADLVAFGDIAEAADEAGLDGVFVWDHVLSPVEGNWPIADPWVALAVAATRSRRIRIGPMVTPLARRRLINVAQATLSLDQLSAGRVILGLGLGSDRARELSAFTTQRPPRRCLPMEWFKIELDTLATNSSKAGFGAILRTARCQPRRDRLHKGRPGGSLGSSPPLPNHLLSKRKPPRPRLTSTGWSASTNLATLL